MNLDEMLEIFETTDSAEKMYFAFRNNRKVTIYRVLNVIRIDIKEKGKGEIVFDS